VEDGAFVVLALGAAFADGREVLGGLWHNVVKELKVDAAVLSWNQVSGAARDAMAHVPAEGPFLVMVPLLSTSMVGPVQVQSK
jgi:hypothetical protein